MVQFVKKYNLDKILSSSNIAEMLDDTDADNIGDDVLEHFRTDVSSRSGWELKYKDSMRLAMQIAERKSQPWDGASNVKFPLLTIAALNFHARAYPQLVDTNDLVKCVIYADDPKGELLAQATRISNHMTWQNIEQDQDWESQQDKLLLALPILGTIHKKQYFDPFCLHNKTELCMPQDFVVNYWAKGNINFEGRATHKRNFYPNEVHARVLRGYFSKLPDNQKESPGLNPPDEENVGREVSDKRQGLTAPAERDDDTNQPIAFLEQICWYDLDGDGCAEPYIATVERDGGRLRRLVARFFKSGIAKEGNRVLTIVPFQMFTKYGFIPSPDGGYMDLGFGQLLGPLNESVDTAINMLFDAGTMSTANGGFLGRGAKFRGGDKQFKPWEWKTVDSTGDDLRKNLVQLPTKEPSMVLFQLLEYLVTYSERIASATEIQAGSGDGQNVKAQTAQILNENGARVYAATYKRIWRSDRDSYRVQFDLNQLYLKTDAMFPLLTSGTTKMINANDYDPPVTRVSIRPSADPTVVSRAELIAAAEQTLVMSMKAPGFNRYQTMLQWLKARKTPNIDVIYPAPVDDKGQPAADYPSPPDPKMLDVQIKEKRLQLDTMTAQNEMQIEIQNAQREMGESQAKIVLLRAQALQAQAEAGAVNQGHAVGAMQVQLQAEELHQAKLQMYLDRMNRMHDNIAKLVDNHRDRAFEATQTTKAQQHELTMQESDQAHEKAINATKPTAK